MWLSRLWTLIALSGAIVLLSGALAALPGPLDQAARSAWRGALEHGLSTLIALGIALAVWSVGVWLAVYRRRVVVRQAAHQLAALGLDSSTLVQCPQWLQPMVQATEDALSDSRAQIEEARAEVSAEPPAEVSAEPPAEVSAEPPEVSEEPSVDGDEEAGEVAAEPSEETATESNTEASVQSSAEASVQSSAEASVESSAEASVESSAEASTEAAVESSAEIAAPQPQRETVVRTGPPRRDVVPEPTPLQAHQLEPPRAISDSLFEMPALRALDAEEDEPETDDVISDADIRRPGEPPPRITGGLLAQLRRQSALEPMGLDSDSSNARFDRDLAALTGESGLEPPSSMERTQIKPMSAELLALNRAEAEAEASTADQEAYYQEVFDRFVQTKLACGESVDRLEFQRFRSKMLRTRSALMSRFDCHDVRFRVYVKEGRAALRAAPILVS